MNQRPRHLAIFILILSGAFLFYKYILQLSPSVMSEDLMAAYHLSGAGLGVLAGCYFYTYLFMQIPAGIILDKYSNRLLISVAIFLCALGGYLFSTTDSYLLACFSRILIGFGASFATMSYMKIASVWFSPKQFAVLAGLFGTACMTGAGVSQNLLAVLVTDHGWRSTMWLMAMCGFVLSALSWVMIRDKTPSQVDSKVKNSDGVLAGLKTVMKKRSNWILLVYSGLAFTPVSVFGGLWGVPYLTTTYQLTKIHAAEISSLVFYGFALGGPIISWLSNLLGKRKPLIVWGTIVECVGLLILLYVPHLSIAMISIVVFLVGVGGSSFLLSYTIGKETNPLALTATVIGFMNVGDGLFGAIADPLIGKFLDLGWHGKMHHGARIFSTHDYQVSLSVLVVYLAAAIVCAYLIKERRDQLRHSPRIE